MIAMGCAGLYVVVLVISLVNSGWCHQHHRGVHVDDRQRVEQPDQWKRHENVVLSDSVKNRRSLNVEEAKGTIPFSERRLEKMLEKAIVKIITGDLSTGDMLLLKSLNYTLDEILAIRERELGKKKEEEEEARKKESVKSWAKALYGDSEKSKHREKNVMDRSPSRKANLQMAKQEGKKNRHADGSPYKDFDFEAYNRQAILDYENLPSNVEFQQSLSEGGQFVDYEETTAVSRERDTVKNLHRDFDKAMEPHVVFKIRYDDSEFDSSSGSDEIHKNQIKTSRRRVTSNVRHTTSRNTADSFHGSAPSTLPATAAAAAVVVANRLPVVYQLNNFKNVEGNRADNHVYSSTTTSSTTSTSTTTTERTIPGEALKQANNLVSSEVANDRTVVSKVEQKSHGSKKVSEYEGLEWVEDDVYRVLPEFMDSLDFENTEGNETSDYEDSAHESRSRWNAENNENDTLEYQNDAADSVKLIMANGNATASNLPLANLSTYLQVAIAHRRGGNLTSSFDSQGEKAIEDIKSRVLALTGRFNQNSNANQVQREKLTMFSPTCQIPRNTDQDAWTDPFSMNMHFQLNLTSGDHVVAAKLRIFKLPQENVTSSTESTYEDEEEDEKIRISVYYYTKSLKKHRSKKRLMDSVVTPLTTKGSHLALDVRQGLRFWRPNPRNPHGTGNNHGLVIQVEDQDGRPLKPAQYIQQPSCADQDSDQKAYQRVPALFIRACTRYVRIVNGKTEMYVNCRH